MTNDDNNMKHRQSDELLSAYIDGELTGDLSAQVEERLRTDPQARQWVAEMRELSKTLRALPREVVGQDLRAAVLHQTKKSLPPETSARRRWIWAAAAVAAALMLTFYLPEAQQPEERQLAAKAKLEESVDRESISLEAQAAVTPATEEKTEAAVSQEDAVINIKASGKAEVAESFAAEEGVLDEVAVRSKEFLAKSKGVSPSYQVQVTFTEAKKFTELLAHHGLSYQKILERSDRESEFARGEQLLVVAPPKQIERVLAACHADGLSCRSLRITNAPDAKQILAWSRWQRQGVSSGDMPENQFRERQSKERAAGRAVAVAPALDINSRSGIKSAEQAQVASGAATQDAPRQVIESIHVLFILREGP